jgi:hypothetical protein
MIILVTSDSYIIYVASLVHHCWIYFAVHSAFPCDTLVTTFLMMMMMTILTISHTFLSGCPYLCCICLQCLCKDSQVFCCARRRIDTLFAVLVCLFALNGYRGDITGTFICCWCPSFYEWNVFLMASRPLQFQMVRWLIPSNFPHLHCWLIVLPYLVSCESVHDYLCFRCRSCELDLEFAVPYSTYNPRCRNWAVSHTREKRLLPSSYLSVRLSSVGLSRDKLLWNLI